MSSRKPGRPGKPGRREEFLSAARELFAEHGYAGTSTDMIVARAGGSKATLYKHFPSKKDLVAGLIGEVTQRVHDEGYELPPDDVPLEDVLSRIGRGILEAVTSDAAVSSLRLCLGEYGRFPELARTVWERGPSVTYANFKRLLARRHELGQIEVDDPQLAAEHFFGSIVGHIQLRVAMGITPPPPPDEMDRRIDAAVRLFLAGYARDR